MNDKPGLDNGADALIEGDVLLGVFGPEMGGNESNKDAPKFDVGLNAFIPGKPVVWGCNALRDNVLLAPAKFVVAVAPVSWLDSEENTESEDTELDIAVFCERIWGLPSELGKPDIPFLFSSALALLNENSEATLAISPFPLIAPMALANPNDRVCCCCSCCSGC